LLLGGALVVTLMVGAGAAGAYVVPGTAPAAAASAAPTDDADVDADIDVDDLGNLPQNGLEPTDPDDFSNPDPPDGSGGATTPPGNRAGRPADALAAWAVPLATRLSIPATALQAYGYTELVLARTHPTCKLSWTTIAGVGKIESDHGRGAGATLQVDGRALPPIVGKALDGQGGRDSIPDTDGGRLDGDRTWDRAVGPLQFIPSTWQKYAVDADADGVSDPNDIDDAALAAGNYLCASGKDLSTPDGWYAAVLTYNAVRVYAADVYAAANSYGVRSKG
jgi:hypothetical protein